MIGLCYSIASVIGRGGKFIGRGSVLGAIFSICWIEPAIFGIENNDSKKTWSVLRENEFPPFAERGIRKQSRPMLYYWAIL